MEVNMSAASSFPLFSPRRIKVEARQLRKKSPVPLSHTKALDLAAQNHGWSSYKPLERAWKKQQSAPADSSSASTPYVVTLEASWLDRGNGDSGTLIARVELTEPWANFLPLRERLSVGYLGSFKVFGSDRTRLIRKDPYATWLSCVHGLSKAARRLVFIDALRVLPCSYAKAKKAWHGDPHRMLSARFPHGDHVSLWWVPAMELPFLLNEPYKVNHERQQPVLAERETIAFTSREWSIHNPEGTLIQFIGQIADQVSLDALLRRANKDLPERFDQIRFMSPDGESLPIFSK